MSPGRRLAAALACAVLAAWALSACGLIGRTDTTGQVDFSRPLPVPPLAPSRVDGEGRRVFDLHARSGKRDFGVGGTTNTWGFHGDYLGPTLRARRGERVQVNVSNGLSEPTTVHWHGMHLPAAADGGPHQVIRPGRTWSPAWTIDQPAATLWYHPHPHGTTETHVYRGLAGLFLVDDELPVAVPARYGVDDVPLVVQDRNFTGAGQFDYERGQSGTGVLGDTLLVNGAVGPYLDVTTERIRLRLLNASNARVYDFGLADERTFALIGTDGGLLPAPHATTRVRLSPGERAEIVVAMRPGEHTTLRSFPPVLGAGLGGDRQNGGKDSFDVLQLRAADRLRPSPALPATLAPMERVEATSATTTRRFRLTGRNINGRQMDLDRIDATVPAGSTEIWEVTGQDGTPHNFHIHGVSFQVVAVGGGAPPPELRGWKDTVFLEGKRTLRLAVRFPHYTDPDVPYMFHCHLLFHEDRGMMGQFLVVEPGRQADRTRGGPGHAGHD